MLTVTAVCVPPGYDKGHLERLYGMVRDHLSQPFAWQPITASDKPGWWAKIDLFEPGRFEGRVLYLDLDVTVTGPLDDLVDPPRPPFVITRDWWSGGYNSSVMTWDAGVGDRIYTNFTLDVMRWKGGDQQWITSCMPNAAILPADWCVSYKHNRRGVLPGVKPTYPDDMRVCVYHGSPKPWEVSDGPEA